MDDKSEVKKGREIQLTVRAGWMELRIDRNKGEEYKERKGETVQRERDESRGEGTKGRTEERKQVWTLRGEKVR